MFLQKTLSAAAVVLTSSIAANAAVVDADTSVAFQLDTSADTILYLERIYFECDEFGLQPCDNPGDPSRLSAGASVQISLGSTLGGDDVFSLLWTNTFGTDIQGVSIGLPNFTVPGAQAATMWLTFEYVDDAFEVTEGGIGWAAPNFERYVASSAQAIAVPVAPVPLPAGLPLLATALLGFGVLRRRG